MRLLFAGTPEAAVPSLRRLADGPHELGAVITRPPAPLGRKRVVTPSPVQAAADDLGLPVVATTTLGPVTERLAALRADLGVIVAYGGLVREPLLSAPRLGWINLHFSLLPRWRGAAPVQRAVLAGDAVTGVSVFRLEAGLDTGPLLLQEPVPIGPLETAGELLDRLAGLGARALASTVDALAAGTAVDEPQRGEPTSAPKLTADDGRIDWAAEPAAVLARIRGATPEPGAFALLPGGDRFKVLTAAPADPAALPPGAVAVAGGRVLVGVVGGSIELLRVQPAGRTALDAAAWARGLTGPVVLA